MSVFTRYTEPHPYLYVAVFTQSKNLPCLIFIHGGPGLNAGVLEYLIEHERIFDTLEYDIVLYDQRGCGRSKNPAGNSVFHQDNLIDLQELYELLIKKYEIAGIIGHSYGAKLLFDYLQNSARLIPGIFVATSHSILVPRINNLLLDLAWLKQVDVVKYQQIFQDFDDFDQEKLWILSEKLAGVFQKNKTRPYVYWANLEWKDKVEVIQNKLGLSINTDVFSSVRKDLYSKPERYSIDIEVLDQPCLRINGFHDFIVNNSIEISSLVKNYMIFYKSAHYPHIEENIRFCEVSNIFIRGNYAQ